MCCILMVFRHPDAGEVKLFGMTRHGNRAFDGSSGVISLAYNGQFEYGQRSLMHIVF